MRSAPIPLGAAGSGPLGLPFSLRVYGSFRSENRIGLPFTADRSPP